MKVYQEWFLAQTHILGRLSRENNDIYVYKYVEKETKLDNKTFPVFNSQIPDNIAVLPSLRFAVSYSRELILFYNNKINRDYLKERIAFVKENKIEVRSLLETNRKIGEEIKTETCLPMLKSL